MTKTEKELEETLRNRLSFGPNPVMYTVKRLVLPRARKLSIKTPESVLRSNLQKLLEDRGLNLTQELSKDIPTHWEKHGDMLLVPSAAFRSQVWHSLGDEVWQVVVESLSCKRLAQKDIVSADGFRSPMVTLLYGDNGWVEQLDNGIRYTYDITKCMFSSGNITEKLRVARFDCRDEIVVDLYAGIGYFTLPYLVYTGVKHLHACEWNPDAVEALHRNLKLNNVEHKCTIHNGDNKKVCPRGVADRVNLGLIPSSREGWSPACAALRPDKGGMLHIHYNVNTKPQYGNQRDKSETSEPQEVFRREAKCMSDKSVPKESCNHGEGASEIHSICKKTSSGVQFQKSSHNAVAENPQRYCAQYNSIGETFCEIDMKNEKANNSLEGHSLIWDEYAVNVTECEDNSRSHGQSLDTTDACIQLQPISDRCLKLSDDIKSENTPSSDWTIDDICSSKEEISSKHKYGTNMDMGLKSLSSETTPRNNNDSDLNDAEKLITRHCTSNESVEINSKWYPWATEVSMEIKALLESIHGGEWRTYIKHIEHVKSYAPYIDHVVLDLRCTPI